jgi:hypothetical protein
MRRQIKVDVGPLLATPLEHLARVVLESGVDLLPQEAYDRPFLLVLDLLAVLADERGVLPDIAVPAQPFEDDEIGIRWEVKVAVLLILEEVIVLLIAIEDTALVF